MSMKIVEQDGSNQNIEGEAIENQETSSNENIFPPATLAEEFKLEKKRENFDTEISWLEYQEKEFSRILGEFRTNLAMNKQELVFPEKYNNRPSKKLEYMKKVEKFFETKIEWSGDKMLQYKNCFLILKEECENLQKSIKDKTEYKVGFLYTWIEGIAVLMHSAPGIGIYEAQDRLNLMEPFTQVLIQHNEKIQDMQRLQQEITGIRADIDYLKEQEKNKEKSIKVAEKPKIDVPKTLEDLKRFFGEISSLLGKIEEQLNEEKK